MTQHTAEYNTSPSKVHSQVLKAMGMLQATEMCCMTNLHELSVYSRPYFIELAHNSMLSHINGHFSKEDLTTLPQ